MNAMSMNNLWSYLQGLSLTASNQRQMGEQLIEVSASQSISAEEEMKLKKLNALFGVWSDKDGKQIDCAGNSKENDAKIRKKGYAKSFQTKNWNIKVFQ